MTIPADGLPVTADHSADWEAVADTFMAIRSDIGASVVRRWAKRNLPPSATILDMGCGSGVPIARTLIDEGFTLYGIDASPSLLNAFRRNCPGMPAACEPVQHSDVFGRTFAAVVAIGLIFLLDADEQRELLDKAAGALEPGGRFLFSAPRDACTWTDTLTGRTSRSLGAEAYAAQLDEIGLSLVGRYADEGGNDYFDTIKRA